MSENFKILTLIIVSENHPQGEKPNVPVSSHIVENTASNLTEAKNRANRIKEDLSGINNFHIVHVSSTIVPNW